MTDPVIPLAGFTGEQTESLRGAAAAAPSVYDTRPWRLVTSATGIGLYLDRDRLLPAVDPDSQQALLACGAALANLRLAIRVLDRRTDVRLLPDPSQPDLLATVRAQGHHPALPTEHELAATLATNAGDSQVSQPASSPRALRRRLHQAVAAEQAWLLSVTEEQRVELAELLSQAHAHQVADPRFLAEWAHHTGNNGNNDGLIETSTEPALPVLGTSDTGNSLIVVVGSVDDTTRIRLQAGQAAQQVRLIAGAAGVGTALLAPIIQVSATRAELRGLLGGVLWPQAALHLHLALETTAPPAAGTPAGGD